MKLGGKSVALLLLFVALALVTYLASQFPARLDFTADRLYSLAPGTKRMLGKIEEPITLRYYYSRSSDTGEVQIQFKNYADRVEEMLRQFASASGGRVQLVTIDPQPDTDEEAAAARAGITSTPLPSGDSFYLGLVVTQGSVEKTIPFFTPQREQFLEFDIAELIYAAQQLERPKLGLITSLPLRSNPMAMPGQRPEPDQMALTQWEKTYEVVSIEEDATELPAGLDVLAVIHPQNVSEKLQFAIDQFLLGGKPVLLAVDPSNYLMRATQRPQNQMMMMQQQQQVSSSNLPKLLVSYGITFDPTLVVGDPEGALAVGSSAAPVTNPLFMDMKEARFNADIEPTSALDSMWILEAGAFTVATDRGYDVTPLIETSDRAGTTQGMLLSFMQPADLSKQFKSEGGKRTIAALVRGSFKTAFPLGAPKDPPPAEGGDAPAEPPAPATPAAPLLTESSMPSTLFVIADSDWLLDYASVQRIQQLNAVMPRNDNLAFSTSIVDYLSGSEDLIGVRGKGRSQRPFDVIVKMEADAQERFQTAVTAVDQRLAEIQQELSKLVQEQNTTQQLIATPEMADAVAKWRAQEVQAKAEKRDIRRQLREGIERLQNRLTAINLLVVPLLILVTGISYFISRQSRRKSA